MKPSFIDLRKKDGSLGDFAECNRKKHLTEEDKVDLI